MNSNKSFRTPKAHTKNVHIQNNVSNIYYKSANTHFTFKKAKKQKSPPQYRFPTRRKIKQVQQQNRERESHRKFLHCCQEVWNIICILTDGKQTEFGQITHYSSNIKINTALRLFLNKVNISILYFRSGYNVNNKYGFLKKFTEYC